MKEVIDHAVTVGSLLLAPAASAVPFIGPEGNLRPFLPADPRSI